MGSDKQSSLNFQSILGARGYEAAIDFPSAVYYRQLLEAYPEAKVVLTVTDPEVWFNNCCEDIFLQCPQSGLTPFGYRVLQTMPFHRSRTQMVRIFVLSSLFALNPKMFNNRFNK